MSLVLILLLCFTITTTIESVQLWRAKLKPGAFLRYELNKASLVVVWAWIIGLCLATTLEHRMSTGGLLACVMHSIIM